MGDCQKFWPLINLKWIGLILYATLSSDEMNEDKKKV
jgi:hypothetical protein